MQLVTKGPYSVSRNPLYLLSIVCAFGVGAQFASLTVAIALSGATFAVFWTVVRHEESLLKHFRPGFSRLCAGCSTLPAAACWMGRRRATNHRHTFCFDVILGSNALSACHSCLRSRRVSSRGRNSAGDVMGALVLIACRRLRKHDRS